MMKHTLFFSAVFFVIVSPVFGELTDQDLDKIRLIVKEEVSASEARLRSEITKSEAQLRSEITKSEAQLKSEITKSETHLKEHVDIKMNSVDKRITLIVGFVSALMVLIVITVGIPQVIMAWRGKNERSQDRKIEELSREIEALKQRHIVSP